LYWAGIYGVALAALGMLGCLPVYLQINFFGPIVANANKMVKIAKSGPQPIEVMDKLNEAGVTATTIGKSFANTIALLTSIALFGAYTYRLSEITTDGTSPNILSPFTFSGLLFGAMIPYAFAALVMTAVNALSEKVIDDIKEAIPKVNEGKYEHTNFVGGLTIASFKLIAIPVAIIFLTPILFGVLLGFRFVSGLVAGTIIAGI